jgi:hypothetical protein
MSICTAGHCTEGIGRSPFRGRTGRNHPEVQFVWITVVFAVVLTTLGLFDRPFR